MILWVLFLGGAGAMGATPSVGDLASSPQKLFPAPPETIGVIGGSDKTPIVVTGKDNPFTQIVELISYIAVIAASLLAISGIGAWRREFKGKRDMELAEDVLCLFYRAQRAMEAIRYPLCNLAEGQARVPEANESPEEKQARDRVHVVFERIREHAGVFDELHALRFRFMARFGQEKAKPFDEMKWEISKVSVCARRLAEFWAIQLRDGERTHQSITTEIKEYERIVWGAGDKDPVESRIGDIISGVEGICRPIIEAQDSWLFRFRKRTPTTRGATES